MKLIPVLPALEAKSTGITAVWLHEMDMARRHKSRRIQSMAEEAWKVLHVGSIFAILGHED
jgi:hypothetical protein